MRRAALILACTLATLGLPVAAASAYGGSAVVAHGSPAVSTQPVSFRGFGRSRGFGSPRGFGRRPYGYRGRRHGIIGRIIRAIAIGYLLHLLFTTPGGLLVLVMMIALVMMLFRRRRRRAYYY